MFYANVTEAQGGGLRSILSPEDGIMLGSDVRVAFVQGNIAAVTRSGIPSLTSFILLGDHTEIQEYIIFGITHIYLTLDFCECRQVLQTQADGGGDVTSSADIHKICNGTLASPCDCDSTSECQVYIYIIVNV